MWRKIKENLWDQGSRLYEMATFNFLRFDKVLEENLMQEDNYFPEKTERRTFAVS